MKVFALSNAYRCLRSVIFWKTQRILHSHRDFRSLVKVDLSSRSPRHQRSLETFEKMKVTVVLGRLLSLSYVADCTFHKLVAGIWSISTRTWVNDLRAHHT